MSAVFLVGFMGAGKSTVGPILARELGTRFVDMDDVITAQAKMSVEEIFEREGEPGFRVREHDALESLQGTDAVVSCGGGVVTSPENRALLRDQGRVVWLRVSADVAFERASHGAGRPLLAEGRAGFDRRFEDREALYAQVAELQVSTDEFTPARVAQEIKARLGRAEHQ